MGQVNLPRARLDLRIGRSIVYEDEDLLVVYKPAGLLTVDDDRGSTNLYSLLKERESRSPLRRDRLFVVHRLDRDTSGLLIFARSARVKDVLQSAFEEGAVERRYEAVVSGRRLPLDKTLRVTINLAQDQKGNIKVVSRGGKECVTYIRCLAQGEQRSLLDVSLLTGRRNQIRLSLKTLGCPIVGDSKYGGIRAERMMLNAYLLDFPSELGLKRAHFEVPRLFAKGFNLPERD